MRFERTAVPASDTVGSRVRPSQHARSGGCYFAGSGAVTHREPPLPCSSRASQAGAHASVIAILAGCPPSTSTSTSTAARALCLRHIHRWRHPRRRPACARIVRRSSVENSPGSAAAVNGTLGVTLLSSTPRAQVIPFCCRRVGWEPFSGTLPSFGTTAGSILRSRPSCASGCSGKWRPRSRPLGTPRLGPHTLRTCCAVWASTACGRPELPRPHPPALGTRALATC